MSKVWDRVVEDLIKHSEKPEEVYVDKPFWQKAWNVIFPQSQCTGECDQGRNCTCKSVCDCCGKFLYINHDNKY